jgi:ribosomal protein S18 acetylase RimI-like enzyme
MGWHLTEDVAAYADRAWGLLAASPVENTVALTVIESVRGGRRWSEEPMLFGWYEAAGEVRGAVSLTPPYELLLAVVPGDSVAELVAALRDRGVDVPGANGAETVVDRFAALWTSGTDLHAVPTLQLRLYRLQALEHPPSPPGRARPANGRDLELAVRWKREFAAEAGVPSGDAESVMRTRIAAGRVWVWDDDRTPVALAARTPPAAGVARIVAVYTPPDRRRRGYGAAVTAACVEDAVARGEQVVLFTDLANPTSNSVYRRIGFRPVGDYRVVRFR